MGGLSVTHWAIILLVVILLFGARRLPDTARGLARSLRAFKSEMGDTDADPARPAAAATQQNPDGWPKLEQPAVEAAPAPAASTPMTSAPVAESADELKSAG